MKKLIQTRIGSEGNCFSAVIACLLDKDSPEDVIQIQEHYDDLRWIETLLKWLYEEGCIMFGLSGHDNAHENEYYLVTGNTKRSPDGSIKHVCIYKNGELFHDPHPDGTGLTTEEYFEIIKKIK